ncbi:MAG: 3-deoxy-8-phosphooctulonate synthase [Pseudomonadota bacterium]
MGVITDYEDADGVDSGDAFVVAPDGSAAGLVWEVGVEPISEILPPDEERWGVYAVCFPHVVRNTGDLASAFRAVLPSLKEIHARVKRPVG